MKTKFLFIPLIIFLTGCPMVDFKELNFTRKKPLKRDIIGVWVPTEETLRDIRKRGHYPEVLHEMTFRADGTFSITNMPDWWTGGFGKSNGKFHSLNGTWSFLKMNNVWDIWDIKLLQTNSWRSIHLYNQKPPYRIFIRIGDPNDGHAMLFERKRSQDQ